MVEKSSMYFQLMATLTSILLRFLNLRLFSCGDIDVTTKIKSKPTDTQEMRNGHILFGGWTFHTKVQEEKIESLTNFMKKIHKPKDNTHKNNILA